MYIHFKMKHILNQLASAAMRACGASLLAASVAISGASLLSSCTSLDDNPAPTHLSADINEANFPDARFRSYLLEQDYGSDGILTAEEISRVHAINVSDTDIASLKGIELFTALDTLDCSGTLITELDLSRNTALSVLDCSYNDLTALDVTSNTALTHLRCGVNHLTELDVSKNTKLTELSCGFNELTSLDVTSNTALHMLACHSNKLSALDVTNNPALDYLQCGNNPLTAIDLTSLKALKRLYCSSTAITTFDLSGNPALSELSCGFGHLTALDLSANPALTELSCGESRLTALDLSHNPALTTLYCFDNQLTALDLSRNPALTKLDCGNNQLTALDLSANPALADLTCCDNQLSALDLSRNPALTYLSCDGNQLTSLDVSSNTALNDLFFYRNNISGKGMDDLISSLPQNTSSENRLFAAIDYSEGDEHNVVTQAQADAVRQKGWSPVYWDKEESEWIDLYGQGGDYTGTPLVILDTDLCSSTDDLFALEMLYRYESEGRCKLLGVVIDREGEQNAAFADVMNTYFGRADVPIGLVRDGIKNPQVWIDYARVAYLNGSDGQPMFSRSVSDYSSLPDGHKLYRRLLARQPDHSVSICSIGFVTALAALLQSDADEYSPLSGAELVRQKVKCIYMMGGVFGKSVEPDFNFSQGINFASDFFRLWPGEVDMVFSPMEVGENIEYKPELVINDISWTDAHPVKQVYLTCNCDTGQMMWDPMAVIQAVEGDELFTLSGRGNVTLTPKAETIFTPSPSGNCRYQLPGTTQWNAAMLEKIRRHNSRTLMQ